MLNKKRIVLTDNDNNPTQIRSGIDQVDVPDDQTVISVTLTPLLTQGPFRQMLTNGTRKILAPKLSFTFKTVENFPIVSFTVIFLTVSQKSRLENYF
jgi:hypothetical protein